MQAVFVTVRSLLVVLLLNLSTGAASAGDLQVASISGHSAHMPARWMPAAVAVRSTCGIAGFDERFLELINRLRIQGAHCGDRGAFRPAAPLGWSARLTVSADQHAIDMATHHNFGHLSRVDGRSVEHRLAAAGLDWGEYAENLAAGLTTVEAVVARWSDSPAHCANLMNPNFTEIGAACAPAASAGRFKTYWALDLVGP